MVSDSVLHSRILIAGAGALGSVYGCFFRRAGYPVTLLGRTSHLDAIARNGLHIEGLWGEHHATGFELITDATQAKTPFDAILVSAKACDTDAIALAIAPVLVGDGVAISLQNGLGNVEKIAAQVGWKRALAARVIFGAEVVAPGRVRVTVYADPVLIGVWQDGPCPHLEVAARRWAERFAAAGIPAAYCDDIKAALWGKVFYNAALNPLSALLGVTYGALAEDVNSRAIMDAVFDEVYAVAAAEGVALPWRSAAEYHAEFYGRLIPSTVDHRSSMLQDLERGRRTEIDAINGEVWRRGCVHGIATPTNEVLTRLVLARQTMGSKVHQSPALTINKETLAAMETHARATYPDECCGMITECGGREKVVPVTNIQDELHAKDPVQFPRTARMAYNMGPEAAPILIAAGRGELRLLAFYHSHPDHDAYFSAEDRTQALGDGEEPSYADVAHIVLAVRASVVGAAKAFAWDAAACGFVEIPLVVASRF
ncbi:MAG: 2-dehydropantoate 2-reductase [Candidatus Binatia bacterium]|jgi:2-dehydropantoate 2-reductase